jgi:hypothetical protein
MQNIQFHERNLIGPYIHVVEFCAGCGLEVNYINKRVKGDMTIGIFKVGFITNWRLQKFYKKCEAKHVA